MSLGDLLKRYQTEVNCEGKGQYVLYCDKLYGECRVLTNHLSVESLRPIFTRFINPSKIVITCGKFKSATKTSIVVGRPVEDSWIWNPSPLVIRLLRARNYWPQAKAYVGMGGKMDYHPICLSRTAYWQLVPNSRALLSTSYRRSLLALTESIVCCHRYV
jgi:hypothetical protein